MSKKHHQRTRADILERRSKPSKFPGPVATNPLTLAAANRYIASLQYTADTRRAMRSKY